MAITPVNGIIQPSDLLTINPVIPINDYPILPGVSRTAQFLMFGYTFSVADLPITSKPDIINIINILGKQSVVLVAIVKHYNKSTQAYMGNIEGYADKVVMIIADTTYYVDTTKPAYPLILPNPDGSYPEGAVRAWDAWVINAANNSLNIINLLTSQVAAENALGNFDNIYTN
jgi:hypothetical protein